MTSGSPSVLTIRSSQGDVPPSGAKPPAAPSSPQAIGHALAPRTSGGSLASSSSPGLNSLLSSPGKPRHDQAWVNQLMRPSESSEDVVGITDDDDADRGALHTATSAPKSNSLGLVTREDEGKTTAKESGELKQVMNSAEAELLRSADEEVCSITSPKASAFPELPTPAPDVEDTDTKVGALFVCCEG